MGGLKLNIHPLFFVFGFYYAATGRIFEFVVYTLTAIIHELGHSFVAAKCGYRLNKMVLMPFGAVVKGDIENLKFIDEIKIALAGPFVNLAVGIFFIAVWWIFPISYAFTDIAAQASLTTALINFLPAFPLDGGRILTAILSIKFGKRKAFIISKALGIGFGLLLFAGFIVTVFYQINLSLLFFGLFVFFGAVTRVKDNVYVKTYTGLSKERLLKGMPYKKQALEKSASVKKMMSILDDTAINEIAVFDHDREIAILSQEKINKIIEKADFYAPIENYLD